ncbi:MAG: hypothetical protein ACE1ZE_06600, partial [Candidatus Binatia bacterium]
MGEILERSLEFSCGTILFSFSQKVISQIEMPLEKIVLESHYAREKGRITSVPQVDGNPQ